VSFAQQSIDDFARQLGSGEPTPGGGATAALLAKLAAALVQMVARHTIGRPKYAAADKRMQAIVAEAEDLGRRAGELMDADAEVYAAVAQAFKRPKTDAQRETALSQSCQRASEVPLQVMRVCARLAELAAELQRDGNHSLRNDAQAALAIARTAADVSAGNVHANQPFIADVTWASKAVTEASDLLAGMDRLLELAPEPDR